MGLLRDIEIVATSGQLRRDFPGVDFQPGAARLSATYTVQVSRALSSLGRFLAEHVTTTRAGEPGSHVRLLLPSSKAAEAMEGIMKSMRTRLGWPLQEQIDAACDDMELVSDRAISEGEQVWDLPDVALYQWPLYGSGAVRGCLSPEGYFDACAAIIKSSGAVVLDAGPHRVRPPVKLIEHQADSRGWQTLARYEAMRPLEQVAA